MSGMLRQMFPPKPAFTEAQLPDLGDRVYMITGATSGLGLALAGMLYSRHATVFLASRSAAGLEAAASSIRAQHPESRGRLRELQLDLGSYATVAAAAAEFLAEAPRLDVLFHNAGLLAPPRDSLRNAHGVEAHVGVHCVGPFLLTRLLEGRLRETAAAAARSPGRQGVEVHGVAGDGGRGGAVRVVWTGSVGAARTPPGGLDLEKLRSGAFEEMGPIQRYSASKAGEYFLCGHFGRKLAGGGVVSIFLDPGNLRTDLHRTFSTEISRPFHVVLSWFLHSPEKGAYTELFAGLAPEAAAAAAAEGGIGAWVLPFGRMGAMRPDLVEACKLREEGGSGRGEEFVKWCEEQVGEYLPGGT